MSAIQEIERAITKLKPTEVHVVADWLQEYRDELWDQQIEVEAARLLEGPGLIGRGGNGEFKAVVADASGDGRSRVNAQGGRSERLVCAARDSCPRSSQRPKVNAESPRQTIATEKIQPIVVNFQS